MERWFAKIHVLSACRRRSAASGTELAMPAPRGTALATLAEQFAEALLLIVRAAVSGIMRLIPAAHAGAFSDAAGPAHPVAAALDWPAAMLACHAARVWPA